MKHKSLEDYVVLMNEYLPDHMRPQPGIEADMSQVRGIFQQEFGFSLPDEYFRIVRIADGVNHNGMTVQPLKGSEFPFEDSILGMNEDLRDSFREDCVYLATMN